MEITTEDIDLGPNTTAELCELGKALIACAREGNVKLTIELMKAGAPFATDWVS